MDIIAKWLKTCCSWFMSCQLLVSLLWKFNPTQFKLNSTQSLWLLPVYKDKYTTYIRSLISWIMKHRIAKWYLYAIGGKGTENLLIVIYSFFNTHKKYMFSEKYAKGVAINTYATGDSNISEMYSSRFSKWNNEHNTKQTCTMFGIDKLIWYITPCWLCQIIS